MAQVLVAILLSATTVFEIACIKPQTLDLKSKVGSLLLLGSVRSASAKLSNCTGNRSHCCLRVLCLVLATRGENKKQ